MDTYIVLKLKNLMHIDSNKDIAAGGVESFNEAENTLR